MSGTRLDVSNAIMPKPKPLLMEAAAEAIYSTMREYWDETSALGGPRRSRAKFLTWDKLDVDHRLRWISAAKEAYCVIALAGGAMQVRVHDIEPGSVADH